MIQFGIKDIIDILIVAVMLYYLYRLMKSSGTLSLFNGVLAFIVIWVLAYKIFDMRLTGTIVDKFMSIPPGRVVIGQSMEQVMKTFDDTGAWNLPVVEPDGTYVGFVSKSKIFNSYRRVLRHYSED